MSKTICNPNEFRRSIHFLRNAAPEEFEVFLKQFSMYTDDVMLAVTQADHVEILKMQGRAQQCLALQNFFVERE